MEATRVYDAHGIAWFRTSCKINAHGKKELAPPKEWATLSPNAPSMRRKGNAVCIRTGPSESGRHVVVIDADGDDAISAVVRLLEGSLLSVPQVQTQRGPSGRHFYFFAEPGSVASTLKSSAGLVIDGVKTGVDIRAGCRVGEKTEGVGFVLAPPTVVTGGGAYTLMPESPAIHEAPFMSDALARTIAECARRVANLPRAPRAEKSSASSDALMRLALRAAQRRAGTDRVGFPKEVVENRVVFTNNHAGAPRVCPVTRTEHTSNHFFVELHTDEQTGPAFFIYCHSKRLPCNPSGHLLLEHVDEESYDAIFGKGAFGARTTRDIAMDVVGALPLSCIESRVEWTRIGEALYNEGYTCAQWDAAMRRSTTYERGACERQWAIFASEETTRNLTVATLWCMLKAHNPGAYWELMERRSDLWELMKGMSAKCTAHYFYNIYPDKYRYCPELGWYEIARSGVWESHGKALPVGLKWCVADTMQKETLDMKKAALAAYAKTEATVTDQDTHRARLKTHESNMRLVHSAFRQFGGSDFVNGVMSFLARCYVVPKMAEKMDMNRYLFAFDDCALDAQTCTIRPIEPDDYVSTTTGYSYPKKSDPSTRAQIDNFLYRLFDSHETKSYLLRVLASCLLGLNRWEEYYVFTGSGGNGKGVVAELIKSVFGRYYMSVDITLFTRSADRRDAPCPALVEARTKRVMLAEEPESEDRLQAGFLKNLSGGSSVDVRTLHSKHIWSYVPPFKIFILTNDIPKLTQMDGGSERRLRVIKFPFKFVAPDKATEPYHRVGDPEVKEKLCSSVEWRDELCLMLIETYAEIKNMPFLAEPIAVKEATRGYVDSNNMLCEWLDTFYDRTRRDADTIGAGVLKQAYMTDMNVDRMSDSGTFFFLLSLFLFPFFLFFAFALFVSFFLFLFSFLFFLLFCLLVFKSQMDFNHIPRKRTNAGFVYTGIKRKPVAYKG
jgi:P4 family phage/plasmid primase-like protien